jgi:hypothetical protein
VLVKVRIGLHRPSSLSRRAVPGVPDDRRQQAAVSAAYDAMVEADDAAEEAQGGGDPGPPR